MYTYNRIIIYVCVSTYYYYMQHDKKLLPYVLYVDNLLPWENTLKQN